ncbi:MAG: HD domain-containing phosphohydrolase, partial [Terracidiphilus sp.]
PYEPFLFNIGSMVATILENRDNTRSLAEVNAQLNRLVDELEDRVTDRTRELETTNESLRLHDLALGKANRTLSTLSACNQALVRAANETELLNSICRLIVETGGYRMAWVGFPEQDPAKAVRPVAQYGHEEGFLTAGKFSWADTELGRGPTGTALRTGTIQVNQNFLTNPALAPWREEALKRDYQSSIALPLEGSAGILGVLTLDAAEPDAFDETEVALLQELAGDLAFGIETFRMRVEHEFNTRELLHHEKILRQSLEDSIKTIANTVEMRDPYTAGHQQRVSQLATAISRELGLPEETILGIGLAANIHDLGKISIPAEILLKPEKLTEIEFMLVKTHSQSGYDTLKDIRFPWPIATMVWQHHERLDGSGYPLGLKGDQILFESRILAVADVVDAMTSLRPYRAALEIDIALDEIQRGRGTAYDPAVVDSCLKLFPDNRFPFPG